MLYPFFVSFRFSHPTHICVGTSFSQLADKNAYLVESMVARPAWKNVPDHPYKTHPVLQTPRLPTLYKWADGKVLGKLIEGEVYDKPKLAAFLDIPLDQIKNQ